MKWYEAKPQRAAKACFLTIQAKKDEWISNIMNGTPGPVRQDACMWLVHYFSTWVRSISAIRNEGLVKRPKKSAQTSQFAYCFNLEVVFVPGAPSYNWLELATHCHDI